MAMTLTDTLRAAVRRSRLLGTIDRYARGARVSAWLMAAVSRATGAPGTPSRWTDSSSFAGRVRETRQTTSRWTDDARISAGATALSGWVRASFLYRWLTTEPEPEVVVIDLRETLTVGPVLSVLDRTIRTLAVGATPSTVRKLATNVASRVRDAPIRVASVAFVVAVVANTLATALLGTLDSGGLGVRLVLAGLAMLGVRVRRSWDDLRETRAVRLVVAALEPPPPPDSSPVTEEDRESEDEH